MTQEEKDKLRNFILKFRDFQEDLCTLTKHPIDKSCSSCPAIFICDMLQHKRSHEIRYFLKYEFKEEFPEYFL